MIPVGSNCTSGDWVVLLGKEDEFVAAWEAFARWGVDTFEAFRTASLIRQTDSPQHFISLGEWNDAETIKEWRQHPEFANKLGAARAFCSSFHVVDYTGAVTVS